MYPLYSYFFSSLVVVVRLPVCNIRPLCTICINVGIISFVLNDGINEGFHRCATTVLMVANFIGYPPFFFYNRPELVLRQISAF